MVIYEYTLVTVHHGCDIGLLLLFLNKKLLVVVE